MKVLIIGALLTGMGWVAAWTNAGILTEYSFFPLWLGYILTMNGGSEYLLGTSLLAKMRFSFILLFIVSIPLWWFFERMNLIVKNWHYQMADISNLHYFIQASIDFSTVVPAVLSTAFLCNGMLSWRFDLKTSPVRFGAKSLLGAAILAILSFALIEEFPHQSFPLVWLAPIFVLEPVAYLCRIPCLLKSLERGSLNAVAAASIGTFFCGFCWELWNFYSFPKWYYTIPYVGCCKIFEMPALGYFGYPFFGLLVVTYSSIVCFIFLKVNIVGLLSDSSVSRSQYVNELVKES